MPNRHIWAKLRGMKDATAILESSYFMSGPAGVGKTTAARCLLTRAYARGPVGIREVTAAIMVQEWAQFKQPNAGKWKRTRLLLIDDMDKPDWANKNALTGLWDLLNHRLNNRGRTIMTSNKDQTLLMSQMRDSCPEMWDTILSIFDRMKPLTTLTFTGESLR